MRSSSYQKAILAQKRSIGVCGYMVKSDKTKMILQKYTERVKFKRVYKIGGDGVGCNPRYRLVEQAFKERRSHRKHIHCVLQVVHESRQAKVRRAADQRVWVHLERTHRKPDAVRACWVCEAVGEHRPTVRKHHLREWRQQYVSMAAVVVSKSSQ